MAMNTDDAFSEAVDAVLDVLAPYELYSLEHTCHIPEGSMASF